MDLIIICGTIIVCIFIFVYYLYKAYIVNKNKDSVMIDLKNNIYYIYTIINNINEDRLVYEDVKQHFNNIKDVLKQIYEEKSIK